MPFNGTGAFTRIYNWVTDQANGIDVRADRMDTDTDDIAAGLSNCITRDGQSPPTANIPMGGMKITGLANGSSNSDAVNYGQVFVNPVFTAPRAVASPAASDSSLLFATTAWVKAMAFNTALPDQAGNAGKFVTTNGAAASWASIYPSQSGNEGKFLSTNGTDTIWADTTPFSSNAVLAQVQASALCF